MLYIHMQKTSVIKMINPRNVMTKLGITDYARESSLPFQKYLQHE